MEPEKLPEDLKRNANRWMDTKRKKAKANESHKQAEILCLESMREHGFSELRMPDEDTVLYVDVGEKIKSRKSKKPQDD